MKWKLKPDEVISYKTSMDQIDTGNHKDISLKGFSKLFGNDSIPDKMNKVFKDMNLDPKHEIYDLRLSEKRKNIIDIEMLLKHEDNNSEGDTSQKGIAEMRTLMNKMLKGVLLRGSIYKDGTIESFYTVNSQKNLLAMFFELPGKTVNVGDSWPLDIHLVSMDQSFVCDSSYHKNVATVTGIEQKDGDNIVNLKYDIIEYIDGFMNSPFGSEPIKTTMKMTYQATAAFSVEKGRWIKYEGVISDARTGFMSMETKQRYTLIEE